MIDSVAMLFLSLLMIYLVRRLFSAAMSGRARSKADGGKTCRCGCDLTDVDAPRCPQCGRLTAFDATAEQLGLTDEELARIGEAQRRRQQASAADAASTERP